MKKASIPAPPQPSFSFPAVHSRRHVPMRQAVPFSYSSSNPSLLPLNADFLRRVTYSSWWVGAVFAIAVFAVTKSAFLAWSFAAGEALSILMLFSQQMFVQRLASTRAGATQSDGKKQSRFPAWLLLPAKYLLLGVLIWALLRYELIQPFAFVMGVPLVQVVITAKAMGRLMMQNRTSIRQAYVEKGKPNAV
jgi:hypothetical protein